MSHRHFALLLIACAALAPACSNPPSNPDTGADVPVADAADVAADVASDMADDGPMLPSDLFGPCYSDSDCMPAADGTARTCLTNTQGWPQGYCSQSCSRDNDCIPSTPYIQAACRPVAGTRMSMCQQQCLDGIDCGRTGYTCNKASGAGSGDLGLCGPSCGPMECGTGATCNAWTATCQDSTIPYPPTTGADDGQPCMHSGMGSECRSGHCHPSVDTSLQPNGWNGGYCESPCRLTAGWTSDLYSLSDTFPQSNCPDGSICFPSTNNEGQDDPGICLRGCTQDSDCRVSEGYYCEKTFSLERLRCPDGGRACLDHEVYFVTKMWMNGICEPVDCVNDATHPCPTGYTCQMRTDSLGQPFGICAPDTGDGGTEAGTDAGGDAATDAPLDVVNG